MVLGFGAQVLKNALFPVTLHMIPVLNHPMSNGIVYSVCFRVGNGFIADEEVQVLDTALGGEMSRL